METCQEKVMADPYKTKAGLEVMEAAVETCLEQMKVRKDVFEEKFDKMDAAGKAYLGKMEANIERPAGNQGKPK
jgi:hypothetical protein